MNSPKGAALVDQCRQELDAEERPKREALNEQKRLSEPSQLPENRNLFLEDYRRFGFEYVIGKYILSQDSSFFQTVCGLMLLYRFEAGKISVKGYIGLICHKAIQDEAINRLLEDNRELKIMFDWMNDGISLLDKDGRVLRINRGFEEITGIPAHEMVGYTAQEGEARTVKMRSNRLFNEIVFLIFCICLNEKLL
ncbi:MAG: 4Fe-4S ferredoxin [Firmicutes bacterium]|nr:4Fe-4S ferredoxin [Bacillota bacterium]